MSLSPARSLPIISAEHLEPVHDTDTRPHQPCMLPVERDPARLSDIDPCSVGDYPIFRPFRNQVAPLVRTSSTAFPAATRTKPRKELPTSDTLNIMSTEGRVVTAQRACTRCSKSKKRCDRVIPCCGLCARYPDRHQGQQFVCNVAD